MTGSSKFLHGGEDPCCGHGGMVFNASSNPLRADPTKTTGIRNKFTADLHRRFTDLKRELRKWLVVDDELGLKRESRSPLFNVGTYKFATDPGKLQAFRDWLQAQVDSSILKPTGVGSSKAPWTVDYIESSYKRGLINAYVAANKAALSKVPDLGEQSYIDFVQSAFNTPEARSKIELLATRTFEDLKGVTATMAAGMNRVLAQGLADGKGPAKIALEMSNVVDGMEKARAFLVARTEIIRAHAEGQLDSFEKLGVEKLGVQAEWSTAGDERVCPLCAEREGRVYSMKQARGLIPLHPNCVLGDSLVEFSDCFALTRVKYFGRVVRVHTSSGRRLSVTENHVLATSAGWVRAKNLRQGHQLLRASSLNPDFSDAPDKNNRIAPISQVFELFSELASENLGIIPRASSKDFHGDGGVMDKEVHVVFSDRTLRDELKPGSLAKVKKISFVGGDVAASKSLQFDAFGSSSLFLHRHHTSPYSQVSGHGVSPVLLGRPPGHHCSVCGGLVPESNATVEEPALNSPTVAVQGFGDLIEALSGPVLFDNVVQVQMEKPLRGGVFAFDVWSHASAYSLEGLLSSNCRCAWVPYSEDFDKTPGKTPPAPTPAPTPAPYSPSKDPYGYGPPPYVPPKPKPVKATGAAGRTAPLPSKKQAPAKAFRDLWQEAGSVQSKMPALYNQLPGKTIEIKPLTAAETEAVTAYSGSAYFGMNSWARGKGETTEANKRRIVHLDNVFHGKKSVLKEGMVVYRGLGGSVGANVEELRKKGSISGTVLKDKGFVSTSAGPTAAAWFGGSVLRVKLPQGTSAIHVNSHGGLHPSELEILLQRGTKFMVTGSTKIKSAHGGERWVYDAVLVP